MNYKDLHGKSALTHQGKHYPHNSLVAHVLAVAACAKVIFEQPQCLKRLHQHSFNDSSLLILIAALHDIGKASRLFQKLVNNPDYQAISYGQAKEWKHGVDGFEHYGAIVQAVAEGLLGLDEIQSSNIVELLFSACGHHGKYPPNSPRPVSENEDSTDEDRALIDLVSELIELFCVNNNHCPTTRLSNGFIHWFAGWVVLADWLGSDSDTFKPVTCSDLETLNLEELFQDYVQCAKQRITDLKLFTAGNPIWSNLVPEYIARKLHASGGNLNPMQIWATEFPINDGKNIIICEVPMGAGKTEFAEIIAARMIADGKVDGMVFALPTQGSANQIHKRLNEDLSYPVFQLPTNLAHANAKWESLSQHDSGQYGNDSQNDVIRWLFQENKRCFLAPVSVVTVDQIELAVLNCKHSFLRAAAMSRHLVVIDEIHAYDAYMSELIQQTLAYLGKMGTPVILLSATLPDKTRNNLLAAYWGEPKININTAHYPRITWATEPSTTAECVHLENQHAPVSEVTLATITDTFLIEEALKNANENCVCVICNSVSSSIERYQELLKARPDGSEIEILLFHARFIRQHRSDKEQEVTLLFDKNSPEPARKGKILVATQVVEQSLDLDFDYLYTELAPIDLILQRMGRLHRHRREYRHFKPCLTVVLPEDSETSWFAATQKIYPHPELLSKTREFIEQTDNLLLPKAIGDAVSTIYEGLEELPHEYQQQSKAANRCFSFTSDYSLSEQIEYIDDSSNTRDAADSLNFLILMRLDNKIILPNRQQLEAPSPLDKKGKISKNHLQAIHPFIISLSDNNPKNPDTLAKKLIFSQNCRTIDSIWPEAKNIEKDNLPYEYVLLGEFNENCNIDLGTEGGWKFSYTLELGLVWKRKSER